MKLNGEILPRMSPEHRYALGCDAIGQIVLLFYGALLLDGGGLFKLALIGTIAYWPACTIILFRRYSRLTAGDLIFFRWGFAAAALLAEVLLTCIGVIFKN
jgi:hypothetical protein